MSPKVVSKAIKAYFEAIRAMDQQAGVNTFAVDAITYDPVGAPPTEGHEKLAEFFQTITAAFKEVGLTEDEVVHSCQRSGGKMDRAWYEQAGPHGQI